MLSGKHLSRILDVIYNSFYINAFSVDVIAEKASCQWTIFSGKNTLHLYKTDQITKTLNETQK